MTTQQEMVSFKIIIILKEYIYIIRILNYFLLIFLREERKENLMRFSMRLLNLIKLEGWKLTV